VSIRRVIRFLIELIVLTLLAVLLSRAQEVRGEVKKVDVAGDEVTLTYDLRGVAEDDYVILVFLVPARRPGAARELTAVRGDVGRGKFAGTGRKIVWSMLEFADLEEGESYSFRISVDRPGIPWYYWAGGGAAVAGGAAIILLKGSGQGNNPGGQNPATNPLPPAR
jgi:hypothetical protein